MPPAKPRTGRRRIEEAPPSVLAARYALLEQAPIFCTLPERTLRQLARRLRPVAASRGTAVVQQGEPASSLFLIASGHCQLRLEHEEGHRVAVSVLGPGDFFGEASVLGAPLAAATAVALDDCHLLTLDTTAFHNALAQAPAAIADLTRFAEQRAAGYAGIAAQLGTRRRSDSSRVVAVYSAKGGSGKTTLALNVAAALSARHPGEVVLLDLSFPYTQAALLANLVPTGSLVRMRDADPDAAEEALLSAVLFHPASLMILPGCIRPEEADLVTPDLVGHALDILARSFPHVVVDLGVAMTESVLAVLDRADHVLLVTTPELAAVKGTHDAHAILTGVLGIPRERIALVLNERAPRSVIDRDALERRVGAPVRIDVAFDGTRPDQAALRGDILAITDHTSQVARAAMRVVEMLDEAADPEEAVR